MSGDNLQMLEGPDEPDEQPYDPEQDGPEDDPDAVPEGDLPDVGPVPVATRAGYGHQEATQQRDALAVAWAASPIRQVRYQLRKLWMEWRHACEGLEVSPLECTIELAGSLTPGMKVPTTSGTGRVVRQMNRDGQLSIHLEMQNSPRPEYLNFAGPASPVVVYR